MQVRVDWKVIRKKSIKVNFANFKKLSIDNFMVWNIAYEYQSYKNWVFFSIESLLYLKVIKTCVQNPNMNHFIFNILWSFDFFFFFLPLAKSIIQYFHLIWLKVFEYNTIWWQDIQPM
jgi:hypothetical protein